MKNSLLLSAFLGLTIAEKCPSPNDIRSDLVKSKLDINAFAGTYYEIAYHDYTQPIDLCGCGRSVKSIMDDGTVFDNATINCGNTSGNQTQSHTYHQPLYFHQTDTPGYFIGKWPVIPDVDFPDTLVDVGPIKDDGQYAWALEFQCVEELGQTIFVGVNFYSSVPEHTYLEDMKSAFHDLGLDPFIYPKRGHQLTLRDYTGCQYDNKNWTSEFNYTEYLDDKKFEGRDEYIALNFVN
jgi:hypothetical protein